MKKISANIMCVDGGGGFVVKGSAAEAVRRRRGADDDDDDKHLARDSFQCYRFSNLGLISMLLMLLVASSSLVVPVNGELLCASMLIMNASTSVPT